MSEFKQIIGRGTRVRDDYGKLWFNIIDYTGSATRLFADPAFDGDPVQLTEKELKEGSQPSVISENTPSYEPDPGIHVGPELVDPPSVERRKYYFDEGLPEGRKNYTKTQPIQFEEFAACMTWWNERHDNERAWKVPAFDLLKSGCNLDRKNPHAKEDIAHLPPEQLVASILDNERRVIDIVGQIQALLGEGRA
jgi:type I restriction enzyme M protein